MKEFTLRALVLGIILAIVFCAANAYIGLKAGMTVSASIPAAVMSMAILRGVFKRGTILENNIVQTIASTGESLAGGIVFTMPALVMTGIWAGFPYGTVTLVGLLGGFLGVLFMIPLRKVLITEKRELVYPEGVACSEVLKTGESGTGIRYIIYGLAVGFLFKFLSKGFLIVKDKIEWAWTLGKSIFYFGSELSVALLGVGYIVGPNIALLVFLGGFGAWAIGLPILSHFSGLPITDPLTTGWELWSTKIRYIGIGAMVVGGLWSIVKVWGGAMKSIRDMRRSYQPIRTEQDMSSKQIAIGLVLVVIPIFILYAYLTHSVAIGIAMGITMVIAGFFFAAVSSYIVGLVGSSNNPVSGMTICTILFTAGLMLILGLTGKNGILATLGVAGVVCCAACTASDISQDLKTGYLVGSTPKLQQWAQIISVVPPALLLAPILTVLHRSYGIGTGLSAPQASLFAGIVQGIFIHKTLPWLMIGFGLIIGVAIIVIDELLKRRKARFRLHVMPVAVGIYLPVAVSVPIMIGGLIQLIVKNRGLKTGTLFSSGLIAGEAFIGIVVAILIFVGIKLPLKITENNILSAFAFLVMAGLLVIVSLLSTKKAN